MTIKYEIRQEVRTVIGARLETVGQHGEDYERVARIAYANICAAHPSEYFELIMVEHKETCLAFTKRPEGV